MPNGHDLSPPSHGNAQQPAGAGNPTSAGASHVLSGDFEEEAGEQVSGTAPCAARDTCSPFFPGTWCNSEYFGNAFSWSTKRNHVIMLPELLPTENRPYLKVYV
jgi:hypothetical protein